VGGPRRQVPEARIRAVNGAPPDPHGRHVLYWMTSTRRVRWSFALDRSAEWCRALGRPLLVLEALRAGYPGASDRLHAFVLPGIAENARALAEAGVAAHAYVEPAPGEGRGLLEALAADACVVVTDDFPSFFLPRMLAAAAGRLRVRLEAVDSNGLLPMRAATAVFPTAHAFRRFLQRELPAHLGQLPSAEPLGRTGLAGAAVPDAVARRWPAAPAALLRADPAALASLPIDHAVPPAEGARGGGAAGRATLRAFVAERLDRYLERSHPDAEASSGLSPWLHFGQVSAHEVFRAIARREGWTPAQLGSERRGAKEGFWGMSPPAEAFLDELVTWRELGFNMLSRRPEAAVEWASLPPWAIRTLEAHAADRREVVYDRRALEEARTHDEVWNAAQAQLRREGRIHNYLRMLWGKKILEWSASPREALATTIALNDRWALDGRDPSSASGIFWCLGRYDRPWGPERPIYGTIRYMSSDATRRKLRMKAWLRRFAPGSEPGALP
jgi:deoxyribodipyrimidine photo-lyase